MCAGCPTTPVRQTSSSPSTGHHKQAVERALNCLTSEMVSAKNIQSQSSLCKK